MYCADDFFYGSHRTMLTFDDLVQVTRINTDVDFVALNLNYHGILASGTFCIVALFWWLWLELVLLHNQAVSLEASLRALHQ